MAWPVAENPKVIGSLAALVTFEILLIRRPEWGVYVMLAGAFFDDLFVPTGFALLGTGDLGAFAALPAWLLHRLLRPFQVRLPTAWYLPTLYLALALASIFNGVAPAMATGAYFREVVYVAATFAICDLARSAGVLKRAAWVMAIGGFGQAVIALGDVGHVSRLGGLADEPNILGTRLAFGALPAAGLLLQERRKLPRLILAGLLTVTLVAVVLTISRGTYISLSVAFLWWMRRYRRLILLAVAMGGLLMVVVSRTADQKQVDYIGQRLQMRDTSVVNRWQVVQNSLKVIQARPFLGVGFNQFTELGKVVDVSAEAGRGAHNFYLGAAATCGVPALLVLVSFIAIRFRDLRRRRLAAEALRDPVSQEAAWLTAMFQAMVIFHALSLTVRGASRITEWAMYGLYAAAALLPGPPKPKESPVP